LALNFSYGKYFKEKPLRKFFRFIFSFLFLPILVMRNFFGAIFSFFVLLPIWGLGIFFALLFLGIIRNSTPVEGNSMNPTILDKENINLSSFTFINKFFLKPERGDIVTFESGRTVEEDGQISSYIKRIVAVGGDSISIRDGFLYVNNELIKEPYIDKPRSTFGGSFLEDCKTIKIPQDYYFVLGDNRKRSKDSRELGLVSINEITSILPTKKQEQFKDRLRDASSDGLDHGLPSFDLDNYYQRINKIREDNNLKPLKRNEKLEKAALARAKSIIENNEIGENKESKYSYSKAIRDAGYSNIVTGEIRTTGYYDSEELSNYWLDYETKENLLNKQFQDTGIASYVGKINDCEIQVIVQEFGGYVPPNYDKSMIEGWEQTLNRLKEIQPSWQKCKEWGKIYEDNKFACDRINEILNIRISNIGTAITRMKNNQWLTTLESNGLNQDKALYDEQENLATKLNSL
jgi:signal peptidase I